MLVIVSTAKSRLGGNNLIVKIILIAITIIVIATLVIIVPCMRMSSYWSRIEEQKEFEKFCKEFNFRIVKENGLTVGALMNSEVID